MESAWLCLLCLASSGLILLGSTEPVLGLQPAKSLPGQSQEETELVRGWGAVSGEDRAPSSPRVALGHLGVLMLPLPQFGGWFWPCRGVGEGETKTSPLVFCCCCSCVFMGGGVLEAAPPGAVGPSCGTWEFVAFSWFSLPILPRWAALAQVW